MAERPEVVTLPTGEGPARIHLHRPAAAASRGVVLLGHGAGGGVGAADLRALTRLAEDGWSVGLVEQPWRVAGRKVATPPPRLDAAWLDLVPGLLALEPTARLVVGGRSAGARVACRTSPGAEVTPGMPRADAVLCLAFPLHPPGRPERSRAAELQIPPAHGIPTLVVQGERDPFGSPEEVHVALGEDAGPVRVHPVSGTHSPTSAVAGMTSAVATWLDGLP